MAWVISLGFFYFIFRLVRGRGGGGVGLKKKIPLWVLIREW